MSVLERLEKSLALLEANDWTTGVDRSDLLFNEKVAYCARGAVVYGGFAGETERTWCLSYAHWHAGACDEDGDLCRKVQDEPHHEYLDVMAALDAATREHLRSTSRHEHYGVIDFNDLVAKDKDDVIAVFRLAIANAKEGAKA